VTLAERGARRHTGRMSSPSSLGLVLGAALFALAARPAPAPLPDSTTTILVVRHAEKDTLMLGSDPRLSAAGVVRAQELARVLANAKIDAIYTTPWQRNRLTAMPLTARLDDTLIVVDAIEETVERLRTRHYGQTVLAVGHSNTVPQIVEQLTGERVPAFVENDYDRLYVITLPPGRKGRLLALRYGAGRP
jgi:broad specificity phosphatase PhoE